jgi:hypothetical protein
MEKRTCWIVLENNFALLSVTYNVDGITILDARIYTPFVYPAAEKLCTIYIGPALSVV